MDKLKVSENVPGSFRDPSGFLFHRAGVIYRQINNTYKEQYERLMASGLYKDLAEAKLLIPHEEIDIDNKIDDKAYKIIKPELIPFVSYPYEWCFSQLKNAALTTLQIQKRALAFGMTLKDCSAYNIQFKEGKPIFIDTLSFEEYREGQPWVAYRQFCQHFLAPLALMSYKDIRISQLLRVYIDGIPLDLASSLLQFRTRFNFSLLMHIHFHAKAQTHFADKRVSATGSKMTRLSFRGLIDSLESAVKKAKWKVRNTEWGDYYENTNYSSESFKHKEQIVADFLDKVDPKVVWDMGANEGIFSRIASKRGIKTISLDVDPLAVEKNYLNCVATNETKIFPLLIDLTNPSPSIGWNSKERTSFLKRGPADTVFALALIHHLAISNNLPFDKIADFFKEICNSLIIEFIPKDDSQVQKLLATREDIFPNYSKRSFEDEFKKHFAIEDSIEVKDSKRTLYLMRKR